MRNQEIFNSFGGGKIKKREISKIGFVLYNIGGLHGLLLDFKTFLIKVSSQFPTHFCIYSYACICIFIVPNKL